MYEKYMEDDGIAQEKQLRQRIEDRIRRRKPTNRLYHNDVADFENAIKLHALALRSEATDMKSICEPDDDFPERLEAEANATLQLLKEYRQRVTAVVKVAEQELVDEWLKSDNKKAKELAKAASLGDWASLAI